MIPSRVGQVNLVDVAFYCLDHEREVEGVIGPVVDSIVDEDLFVGFYVSGSTYAESISVSVPLGILSAFVERVICESTEGDDTVPDRIERINGVD